MSKSKKIISYLTQAFSLLSITIVLAGTNSVLQAMDKGMYNDLLRLATLATAEARRSTLRPRSGAQAQTNQPAEYATYTRTSTNTPIRNDEDIMYEAIARLVNQLEERSINTTTTSTVDENIARLARELEEKLASIKTRDEQDAESEKAEKLAQEKAAERKRKRDAEDAEAEEAAAQKKRRATLTIRTQDITPEYLQNLARNNAYVQAIHINPIRRDAYRVTTLTAAQLLALAEAFPNIIELNLSGAVGLNVLGAVLNQNPDIFANLTDLNISNNVLGDTSLEALTRARFMQNLDTLNLSANGLDARRLGVLLVPGILQNLREINLSNNNLTDAAISILLKAPFAQRLRNLNLKNNQFSYRSITALSKGSKQLPSLRQLSTNFSSTY